MIRFKIYRAETKTLGEGRVRAVVSTETKDRDGDIIRQSGWMLDNFLANPLLLASHDYYSLRSVIGSWESMKVIGARLEGVALYLVGQGNEEADWAYKLAENGLAAYSVGFIPKEFKQFKDGEGYGYEFTRQELLEVSHVSVPSNPQALQLMAKSAGLHPEIDSLVRELLAETKQPEGECMMPGCEQAAVIEMPMCKDHVTAMMQIMPAGQMLGLFEGMAKAGRVMSQANLNKLHSVMTALDDIHTGVCDMGEDCPIGKGFRKAAIPPHSSPKAGENTTWDAGTEVRQAEGESELRRMHSWVDAEGDPEAKASYKLPHHLHTGEVVWAGVAAAAQRLGSTDIPESDMAGVKAHLARHYGQFDRTPPWESQGESFDIGSIFKEAVAAAIQEVM